MCRRTSNTNDGKIEKDTLSAITCSKLTLETLKEKLKYVQN